MYKPCRTSEMVTKAKHQKPKYTKVGGRDQKTFEDAPRPNLRGKLKSPAPSGDITANGLSVVQKKPTFQTWYKADLESGDRLIINGQAYEVDGDPENVEGRGRFCVIVLKRIQGGA